MPINNYNKKMVRMLKSGELAPKKGEITHVIIAHDDWCNIFKGGSCNCNPSIKQVPNSPMTRGENGE